MTTPSSGPISIQSLKDEWTQWAGYNDLNSWGQLVLGRPSGQAVSLSEFYGRSNVTVLGPYNLAMAPPNSSTGEVIVGTGHGNIKVIASNVNGVGVTLYFSVTYNPTAWSKFLHVVLPNSATIGKGSFAPYDAEYYSYLYGAAIPGGGLVGWYFNP